MSTPVLAPDQRERPAAAPTADAGCEACPHPAAEHDAIAARYCRASVTSQLTRSCVCTPA